MDFRLLNFSSEKGDHHISIRNSPFDIIDMELKIVESEMKGLLSSTASYDNMAELSDSDLVSLTQQGSDDEKSRFLLKPIIAITVFLFIALLSVFITYSSYPGGVPASSLNKIKPTISPTRAPTISAAPSLMRIDFDVFK